MLKKKRLIEEMLGLDVFDRALDSCRRDVSIVKSKVFDLERRVEVNSACLEEIQKRVDSLKRGLGPEPLVPSHEEYRGHNANIERDRVDFERIRSDALHIGVDIQSKRKDLDRLDRRIADIKRLDRCPTCDQMVSGRYKNQILVGLKRDRCFLDSDIADLSSRYLDLQTAMSESKTALSEVESILRQMNGSRERHAQWMEFSKLQDELVAQALSDAQEVGYALIDLEDELDIARCEHDSLVACACVLGIRGIRAQVIFRALNGLEYLINSWLSSIFPGVSVEIRPDTELRSGGTTDRISITIHGVGHNEGYDGCSGGQRRRIDVAYLLALSELRFGALGHSSSLLCFDEVFDTLDPEGISRVSTVMQDISQDRCVLVITHSEDLAQEINSIYRCRFDDGIIVSEF